MVKKNNENLKKRKFLKTKKKNKKEGKTFNNESCNDHRKNKKADKKQKTFENFKKNKYEYNQNLKNKNKRPFNKKYKNEKKALNKNTEDSYENCEENYNSSVDHNIKDENNLMPIKNKTYDSNEKNNKVDYIDYINMTKNSNNLDKLKIENNEIRDLSNEKVYKIFLLFSPLASTCIKNKICLINADDHMLFFEKKLKNLESLMKIENNDNNKKNIERKIQSIKNKLDNVRPDILFFTLLCLRDSILNKKQRLEIYIHTVNNLLISVSPLFRVPRNFALFKKVMLNLLKNGVIYDDNKQALLKILPHSIKHYIGNSICVGVSNKGFPTDVKKFTEKVKSTNYDYSFFVSLSNMYDVTKFIEITKKKVSEEISLNYLIKLSDLKLSSITICSKLTHFLN